jgi:hypothetical protein
MLGANLQKCTSGMCKDFDETQTDLWEELTKIENDDSNYALNPDSEDIEFLEGHRNNLHAGEDEWHLIKTLKMTNIIFNMRDTVIE